MPNVPGKPSAVEILRDAHFRSDETLGPRGDAERGSAVERAVVGDRRIAFDPTAAERELRAVELGQARRVAANRGRHVLRRRDADARHAARRRRHDVLQVGAVSLAVSDGDIRPDHHCACNSEELQLDIHDG